MQDLITGDILREVADAAPEIPSPSLRKVVRLEVDAFIKKHAVEIFKAAARGSYSITTRNYAFTDFSVAIKLFEEKGLKLELGGFGAWTEVSWKK